MAATPSVAASLMSLPTELHIQIVANLPLYDTRSVSLINRHFSSLPPIQPTHAQLLQLETEEYAKSKGLLACAACLKLRKKDAFPTLIMPHQIRPGETEESSRFCHECGIRDLDGSEDDWLKFCRGARWRDGGGQLHRFARCLQCERCQEWSRAEFPMCSVYQGWAFCAEHHASDCIRCGESWSREKNGSGEPETKSDVPDDHKILEQRYLYKGLGGTRLDLVDFNTLELDMELEPDGLGPLD